MSLENNILPFFSNIANLKHNLKQFVIANIAVLFNYELTEIVVFASDRLV